MAVGYERTIRHYESDASTLIGDIDNDGIAGCWFELHRQGGCGAGELRLKNGFLDRHMIDVGDWISFEYTAGNRWYFGRVESREADSPASIRYRLEGMSIELNEVFPGGFGLSADGVPPHRYANTDLFQNDPDYLLETFDSIASTAQLVTAVVNQYVVPSTHISLDPLDIEEAPDEAGLTSFKFRGEESVRSILKDLSLRANNASWGVDEAGAFYFQQPHSTVSDTLQEAIHLSRLEESRDRDMLYNRVLLTGGYVYDEPVNSYNRARGFYRWRAHYLQPDSRSEHGERRIRLWVPWIRTETDSLAFIRQFFRTYSRPVSRYLIDVPNRSALLKPWEDVIRLLDRNGHELLTAHIETVRVQFDRAPAFRMELGPADPHTLWPEPPHDERWEVPDQNGNGGTVSLTPDMTSFSLSSESSVDSVTSQSSENSVTSEESVASTLEPTTTLEPSPSSSEITSGGLSSDSDATELSGHTTSNSPPTTASTEGSEGETETPPSTSEESLETITTGMTDPPGTTNSETLSSGTLSSESSVTEPVAGST